MATWDNFSTSTLRKTNFFTTDFDETLLKDNLDNLKSKSHIAFYLPHMEYEGNWGKYWFRVEKNEKKLLLIFTYMTFYG
jgi:hypothetical protein